jgi:hypothetical protein
LSFSVYSVYSVVTSRAGYVLDAAGMNSLPSSLRKTPYKTFAAQKEFNC